MNKKLLSRRTMLDHVKKEEMLTIFLRNREAFETAKDVLTFSQVRIGMGLPYAFVWSTALKMYELLGELPPRGSLTAELHNQIAENPNQLDKEELRKIDDFLEYVYDTKEHGAIEGSKTHVRIALDTMAKFVAEVKLLNFVESVIRDGTVPTDLVEEIDRFKNDLTSAAAVSDVSLDVPFPLGWDKRSKVRLFTTGCSILDDFMGGGWRAGEVILFLGPYGSCKTTLACHSVAQLVRYCAEEYAKALEAKKLKGSKKKPKRPVVVLIFTEGDKDTYRCRLLSHMARVPWKKLMTMQSLSSLSTSSVPGAESYVDSKNMGTEYEKKEFASNIETGVGFVCERERVKMAVETANKHLLLVDCTDSDDSPYRIGRGGIPEIANVIRAHFRKHSDSYPIAFWLDHVSALVDRMTAGQEDDKLYLTFKRIPLQCVDKLAKPFNAPVALIHQLAGEANKTTSSRKVNHANAAGSTSIGEYVDFAFVTDRKPDERGLCLFRVTKHRREPPQPFKVVEVQGNFNRLIDRSKLYTVPPGGSVIVPKQELEHYTQLMHLEQGQVVTNDDLSDI